MHTEFDARGLEDKMRGFVASWFFPPATSSEGIVTYKLLKNSEHVYDVCCSTSKQWGYKAVMKNEADNITVLPVQTDSIDEWVTRCVEIFEKEHAKRPYDFLMTRSMPPESVLVGFAIKKKHPEIKWMASFGDPLSNNPYETRCYIDENPLLRQWEKDELRAGLRTLDGNLTKWEKHADAGIRLMCKLHKWQSQAFKQADLLICPSADQMDYMYGNREWGAKCLVLGHSFDPAFYAEKKPETTDEMITLTFIGYSDELRSIRPFIEALHLLKRDGNPAADKIRLRFVGNNPRNAQDMALNYFLQDQVLFEANVDYMTSLSIMQKSDWLLHVDAFFPELPGGSIFFAGKLADYMGTDRPILALTGERSTAARMVGLAGGVVINPWEVDRLAQFYCKIANGETVSANRAYRDAFSSVNAAKTFDAKVKSVCGCGPTVLPKYWPECRESSSEKVLTVCVPSYNVSRYLSRCISTLVDHENAGDMEILIVNDGSKDQTPEIGAEFEKHYPGIVRVINKENGGHGSTINTALAQAKGKYFMVVDGDDWVDSRRLSELLDEVKKRKLDTDVLCTNYHEVDMGSGKATPWLQSEKPRYGVEQRFDELDVKNVYFTLANSMFKTDVLRKSGMKLQEHTFYVDVEYILFPIPFVQSAIFFDLYIYKYCRGNAEQSVHIPNMVNRYDHHERVMKRVLAYYSTQQMQEKQRAYMKEILCKLLFTHYSLFMVYDKDKQRGYARGKDFDSFLKQTNKELYQWIGHEMPMVKVARRCGFDYRKAEKSLSMKLVKALAKIRSKIKSAFLKVVRSRIVCKLMYNRLVRVVTHSDKVKGNPVFQKVKKRIASMQE